MNTITELLTRAESAVRSRDEPEARRLTDLAADRMVTLGSYEAYTDNGRMDELAKRMLFVTRWLNLH